MGIRIRGFARIVLSAAWFIPAVAAAQSGTSTIAGFVRDGSEGALPGAAVTVVNEETGVVEAVTVVAVAPMVDSQSSSIAQTVTREMIAALPLPNRAASSLVTLAPGVIMIDSGAGTAENRTSTAIRVVT